MILLREAMRAVMPNIVADMESMLNNTIVPLIDAHTKEFDAMVKRAKGSNVEPIR